MSSNTKRIFISMIISLVGLCSTWFYFAKYYPTLRYHIDEKPLAKVENLENISRKKLAEHRAWQIIEFGDSFYSGETIKTSADSDLSIRFLDSNTLLNLESDSLITIQRNKNEISLNLLEGNLFVDSSKNTTASALKLETASGLIDLTKTSASLSKNKGSELRVDILSGEATLQNKDGRDEKIVTKRPEFVITEPVQMSLIESRKAEIKISWLAPSNLTAESLQFRVGSKRSDVAIVKPISALKNSVILPAKFGKNFILVDFLDKSKSQQSGISVKFELKQIIDPITQIAVLSVPIVKPSPVIAWLNENDETQTYLETPEINLQWTLKNPSDVKKIKIKILDGEKIIQEKFVQTIETTYKMKLPQAGRYVASVEAVGEADESLTRSKIKNITSEELPYLPAPKWSDNSEKATAKLDGSYTAEWVPIDGVDNYKLELKNPKGRSVRIWTQKTAFIKLFNLIPGQYTLTLTTIDEAKRLSPYSAIKTIEVMDSSEIIAPKLKKVRFK